MKDGFSVIGQPLPKIDAWAKVTGETRYADDLVLPRMAYGKLLRSSHAHARIVTIDVFIALAIGSAAGLALGVASARFMASLFYQVKATDPPMLIVPAVILALVAVLAAIPAVIRASRVDPASMLRVE